MAAEQSASPEQLERSNELRRALRRGRRADLDTPKTTHDFVAFKTSTQNSTRFVQHNAAEGDTTRVNNLRAAQTRWRLNIPMNNITRGSGLDPFAATIIPMSSDLVSLLHYAKSAMIRGAYGHRLDVLPHDLRPMTHMYQSAQEYVFERVLRHEYLLYPFLAAFSQRFRSLTSAESPSSLQNPEWYHHMGIRAVRTAIADNGDNASTMDTISIGVCFMVCATAMMFRCEETRIHLQAFMKFLPYLDTKNMIGYWRLETVSALDIFMSAALGQEPVLRVATSDPGPLSTSEKALIKENLALAQQTCESQATLGSMSTIFGLQQAKNPFDLMRNPAQDLDFDLGQALQDRRLIKKLHPLIVGPIAKLLECLMVAKFVWRAPQHVTTRETQWLCRRSQAVLHDLLSLNNARKIPTCTSIGRYSECLRLTLILVMTSALYRLQLSRKMQVERLKVALERVVSDRILSDTLSGWTEEAAMRSEGTVHDEPSHESDELLLWMLFIGYWASSGTIDTPWFAEAIPHIGRDCLNVKTLEEVEAIMRKYLYGKTVQHFSLTEVAALLSGGTSSASTTSSNTQETAGSPVAWSRGWDVAFN